MALLWKIGADDVSEETQRFKDKLEVASKGSLRVRPGSEYNMLTRPTDGHIASQQTQIMRQAEELEEIKKSLNEAFHKVPLFNILRFFPNISCH
jgi:hypothetical protein